MNNTLLEKAIIIFVVVFDFLNLTEGCVEFAFAGQGTCLVKW